MAKYLNLDGLRTLWTKAKNTFAPKTHTHNFTEVQEPIAEKTYTGLIASSNTNGNGADFIMIDLAHVSDTSKIFKLRVRIEASYKRSNDNVTYTSTHDCLIYGTGGNGTLCYAMWNNHMNATYRPMYYFVAYRPSSATANWKLGVCLYNCNNNTTAGNERTITMKVISQENCSATLYDSCANTDYSTYYKNMAGRTTYDCASNGLQESGDNNTTTNVYAKEITGYSGTAAGTAAKGIDFAQFVYTGSRVFKAFIANANTANTPTINVNGQGAKALYLLTADNTWTATSSTVKTITAGSHWFFWNGTYMYMLPDACNSSAIPTDVAYINGQAAYVTKNVFVNGVYLIKGTHFRLRVDAVNTNTGNLSLNVNCQGAKPLFINGARANGTSKNLVVGWYEVVYDGTNYNAYNAAGGGIVYPEASHADSASSASALSCNFGSDYIKTAQTFDGAALVSTDATEQDSPQTQLSKNGVFAGYKLGGIKWAYTNEGIVYSPDGGATTVNKSEQWDNAVSGITKIVRSTPSSTTEATGQLLITAEETDPDIKPCAIATVGGNTRDYMKLMLPRYVSNSGSDLVFIYDSSAEKARWVDPSTKYLPNTATINGKPVKNNPTLYPSDIGSPSNDSFIALKNRTENAIYSAKRFINSGDTKILSGWFRSVITITVKKSYFDGPVRIPFYCRKCCGELFLKLTNASNINNYGVSFFRYRVIDGSDTTLYVYAVRSADNNRFSIVFKATTDKDIVVIDTLNVFGQGNDFRLSECLEIEQNNAYDYDYAPSVPQGSSGLVVLASKIS